jgi:hypothetical protein
MGDTGNIFKILFWKREVNRWNGKLMGIWENNIKVDINKRGEV